MSAPPKPLHGALFGLAAAALFGLSAPLAKLLLDDVPPVLLAGLLYLGAAIGLWLHRLFRPATTEAKLGRSDVIPLAGVVALGGLLGPVLMLLGLARVTALAGSLLLNLEAPLTAVLAMVLFREHLGRQAALAIVLIVAGAAVLQLEPGKFGADSVGVLFLGLACSCWAVDNNLTQRLSLRDPFAIVRVKTLVAGLVNTALGLWLGDGEFPPTTAIVATLLLGSLSYGVSVVLDVYALRWVGAAREAAYFATAPFIGAIAAVVLGDPIRWQDALAMLAMAMGVVALLRERHGHVHEHEPLEHEHLHEHDEHHQHGHVLTDPAHTPHSHAHQHDPLVHDHEHLSDAHHRHDH